MSAQLFEIFSKALRAAGYSTELSRFTALVPEASTRRYYRLHLTDGKTLVVASEDASSAKINMPNVIAVQAFLQTGNVNVPEIIYTDMTAGIMLQQDLGDMSLNQILKAKPDQADLYYQEAILHVLKWQRLADDGKCPAFRLSFDVTKLMFEFDFFIEHTLLGYYQTKAQDSELKKFRSSFLKIAEELAEPANKVFTHRDYHSRNIYIDLAAPTPHKQYIIDFQDARMGLMQYDLCSLLCDAYAPMASERRAALTDFAFEQGKDVHQQSRTEFDYYFRLSAFQRTVKAMGTFGRQAALGREDFAAYLQPAWGVLKDICQADEKLNNLARALHRVSSLTRKAGG